jgi:recombination associated protein RdgC
MQLMEKVRETEFLGREFLLWLWYRCETYEGRFDLGEDGQVELWFDRKIVLQSESDHGAEKITCSGENPHLREARFALTKNKEITEAMVKLAIDDNEWSFILDSAWMNFKSFKTPKLPQDSKEDPEGFFYEKFFLIEKAINTMNAIYGTFIKLRISPQWASQELPAILEWIREGK